MYAAVYVMLQQLMYANHDNVMTRKNFPNYYYFMRGMYWVSLTMDE